MTYAIAGPAVTAAPFVSPPSVTPIEPSRKQRRVTDPKERERMMLQFEDWWASGKSTPWPGLSSASQPQPLTPPVMVLALVPSVVPAAVAAPSAAEFSGSLRLAASSSWSAEQSNSHTVSHHGSVHWGLLDPFPVPVLVLALALSPIWGSDSSASCSLSWDPSSTCSSSWLRLLPAQRLRSGHLTHLQSGRGHTHAALRQLVILLMHGCTQGLGHLLVLSLPPRLLCLLLWSCVRLWTLFQRGDRVGCLTAGSLLLRLLPPMVPIPIHLCRRAVHPDQGAV